MKTKRLFSAILLVAALFCGLGTVDLSAAPEIPGEPIDGPVAIVGGTLHPVDGATIENGVLLFRNGRIVALGDQVQIPDDALRVEAAGQHIYPGLMDAFTDLGLVEINAVRASVDHSEAGELNPNVRAWVAVNPDSELIPVTRSNGVLLALTAPGGGLISGQSAVVQLDGWTWEDLTVRPAVGMHVNGHRLGSRRVGQSTNGIAGQGTAATTRSVG